MHTDFSDQQNPSAQGLYALERRCVLQTLAQNRGDRVSTAQHLCIPGATLDGLLRSYAIDDCVSLLQSTGPHASGPPLAVAAAPSAPRKGHIP